jgi:nitrate reductase gamma subunit
MLKFEITFGDLLTIIAIVLTLLIYLHSRSVEKRIQKASFLRDYLILFLQSPLSDTFF